MHRHSDKPSNIHRYTLFHANAHIVTYANAHMHSRIRMHRYTLTGTHSEPHTLAHRHSHTETYRNNPTLTEALTYRDTHIYTIKLKSIYTGTYIDTLTYGCTHNHIYTQHLQAHMQTLIYTEARSNTQVLTYIHTQILTKTRIIDL